MDDWINTVWYIHTAEHHAALRRNKIMVCAATWTNLEDITLSELPQAQKEDYYGIAFTRGT